MAACGLLKNGHSLAFAEEMNEDSTEILADDPMANPRHRGRTVALVRAAADTVCVVDAT